MTLSVSVAAISYSELMMTRHSISIM